MLYVWFFYYLVKSTENVFLCNKKGTTNYSTSVKRTLITTIIIMITINLIYSAAYITQIWDAAQSALQKKQNRHLLKQ